MYTHLLYRRGRGLSRVHTVAAFYRCCYTPQRHGDYLLLMLGRWRPVSPELSETDTRPTRDPLV